MRRLVGVGAILLALAGAGCTSVKMVQRDGCWVRRTEKSFGRVVEEVGPCPRAHPQWAQDRLLRLVQECVAQADWRWHTRALEVWSRGLPYPTPQPREEDLLQACMVEARAGMTTEIDGAHLESRIGDLSGRVAELSGERDALRGDAAREHAKLQEREDRLAQWMGQSHDKLAEWLGKGNDRMSDWLGQAAQKPPGNATATANATSTSDGKAATTNESGATLAAESGASTPPAAAPVSSASVVLPQGAQLPAAAPPPGSAAAEAPPAQPAPKQTKHARRVKPLVRPAASKACAPPAVEAGPCAPTPGTVTAPAPQPNVAQPLDP